MRNKVKIKFRLASMKSNTVLFWKIFQVTLSRKLVPAFRGCLWLWKLLGKPPVIHKLVPKNGYDMYTRENRLIIENESRNRSSGAAFGTIFRISNYFQSSKQNFIFIFYCKKAALTIKNHLRIYRKYWFNFKCLKKIFIWWPSPFNEELTVYSKTWQKVV